MNKLPTRIASENELEEIMTRPSAALIEMMGRLQGDLVLLGIAGKLGKTLGGIACRAIQEAGVKKRVIGVSRFSETESREGLEKIGIETIVCDLLDRETVGKLPQISNVIFMAGRKFGTDGTEPLTWAMNALVPANAAHHFSKSRIVAFSTGCVYPLVSVSSGGCTEEEPPNPVGEYSQSCLGRERVFQYFSQKNQTPTVLIRLNYAIDLRYGVLLEIGQKIWNGKPVDLSMGHVNVIWQGDANTQTLLALEHCATPAKILNVTGPETVPVRYIAERFGQELGKQPQFVGVESLSALLSNAAQATRLFGYPTVSLQQMITWVAGWIHTNGRTLGKPSHFEVRDGKF